MTEPTITYDLRGVQYLKIIVDIPFFHTQITLFMYRTGSFNS